MHLIQRLLQFSCLMLHMSTPSHSVSACSAVRSAHVQGPFYASKASRDAPSMLVYRPPESWAPNADWTVSLPAGEDAVAVAAGRSFCAVATSRHLLRLFSLAGARF